MFIPAQSIRIRTQFQPVLKLSRKKYDNIRNIELSSFEDISPSSTDTLSHAIRLYSTMRELWSEGSRSENGVCYVKQNGEFVKVTMTRPKR